MPPVVKQVEGLEIVLVEDAQQRALWNTLLHYEHPVGTTIFAGAQIRYLIRSAHGYLGAIGFSASALHLAPREKWMAWSEAQRKAYLNRVVGLSRFLIRPSVRCRHLVESTGGALLPLGARFRPPLVIRVGVWRVSP